VSSVSVTLNTLLLKRFVPSIYRDSRHERGVEKTKRQLTPLVTSK